MKKTIKYLAILGFAFFSSNILAAGQGGMTGDRVVDSFNLSPDALKGLEKISFDLNVPVKKLLVTEKANTLSYLKFDKPFKFGIDWDSKTITFKDGETLTFGELAESK